MFDSHYSIVESSLFIAQRDIINPDVRRMDQILDGVMWGLGQNPEQLFHISGRLWLAKTELFPDAPGLRVWFKLDGDQVELLAIEKIDGVFSS